MIAGCPLVLLYSCDGSLCLIKSMPHHIHRDGCSDIQQTLLSSSVSLSSLIVICRWNLLQVSILERSFFRIHKMGLRSTAANLSKIRKPTPLRKIIRTPLAPKPKADASHKKAPKQQEKLEVLDHNIELDFGLRGSSSLVEATDRIVTNQWAEQTVFHNRYFSTEAKESARNKQDDLLFLLRGLSMEIKADIIKYRSNQLPWGGMVTISQLYSMFDHRGNTFVDRSLELCVRDGTLMKFVISNALPVILRYGKGGGDHKVTYGYEDAEVVVKKQNYLGLIEKNMEEHVGHTKVLKKFKHYVINHPEALFVTSEDFDTAEITKLVKLGFLTLTSNHHNEIDIHDYALAYPKCGTFLKIVNAGRSWLVKTLSKMTYKEMLEEAMYEKWEGKIMANFRRPFYGYDLSWILADARGSGVVEPFSTPVGRGWRLTGKL